MCDYKYLTDLVSLKLLSLKLWNSKSCLAYVTNDELVIGHMPLITEDMLLPHFAEFKLCQETPTLMNTSDMEIHLLPATCVNTKGR